MIARISQFISASPHTNTCYLSVHQATAPKPPETVVLIPFPNKICQGSTEKKIPCRPSIFIWTKSKYNPEMGEWNLGFDFVYGGPVLAMSMLAQLY